MLVLYEADAIAKAGHGAYLLRTLLSEGEIRHETVEKAGKGFATKKITKSGPTGLIVTTTATGLDAELETRMLSLAVTDTPEQTRAVFRSLARSNHSAGAEQVDYDRWHRLQRWLAAGQRNVIIPFAEQLADRVLALAVRQRRDFGAMLTLIRAHALLHRASRDRTEAGAIIATIEDYAVVRELVADLFSEGIEATVLEYGSGNRRCRCGAQERRGVAGRARREARAGQKCHQSSAPAGYGVWLPRQS